MKYRLRNIFILTLSMNTILLYNILNLNKALFIICGITEIILYLYINIRPLKIHDVKQVVEKMISGYELIIDSVYSIFLEFLIYLNIFIFDLVQLRILAFNIMFAFIAIMIPFVNGYSRTVYKRNFTAFNKILILVLWWIPFFNILVLTMISKKVKYKYHHNLNKDDYKKENDICSTKYPIVLVHGIFARDWMFIDYWGRIPNELIRNGAVIYYGKQQSANCIKKSACEIKNNIIKIIKENKCEKVNIIAHSKGGLDCRYAISILGLSKYTASLTTINTPHRGCKYVDFLLNKIPKCIQRFVAKKYNNMFIKLGDKEPDFLAGVEDLKASKCREFNKKVLDCKDVYYQSVTTKMNNMFCAKFPLNAGYLLAKCFEGENDGLVSVSSSKWGKFLGVLSSDSKGISHADAVDMCGKDIGGFDVRDFYIKLLKDLKKKGL